MTDLAGRDRITIGVLGGRSWIANTAVIPAIAASRGATLGSVGSRTGPLTYQDVLDDPANDAVYIPLPNGMHLEWVERAAAAGKHVLCEKPLAATVVEVEAMAAACERGGVLLAEAYMSPYHPRSIEIARRLVNGDVGEIRHAQADFTFALANPGTDAVARGDEVNYRWLPEQGGGALLDVGIYCLTPLVKAFGGPPQTVVARCVPSGTGVDATTTAWLEWPAPSAHGPGITASVVVSFELPERQWFHVTGTEGAFLTVDRPFTPGVGDTAFEIRRPNGEVERFTTDGADCYVGMVDAFADALTGRAAWPRPASDVIANIRLCEQITAAALRAENDRSAVSVVDRLVRVAPDVDVRILERGEGSSGVPFLLVHGLASNARLWDGAAEVLADAGHHVVAVDQRGHGRSSKPDFGYDFTTIVSDLVALITDLGWERPVVAGQSWGGNVVVELAATHPQLLGAVAAVDGGFIELGDRFDSWEACRERLAPPRLVGTPATTMEQWIRRANPDWPESGIQGALANFEVRADGTIAPWLTFERHLMILEALYGHRPSARFPEIVVPALLIPADTGDVAWTRDKAVAVDAAVAALPRGRVRWFAPAHHDIHAQHPLELAKVLLDLAEEADRE